MKIGNPADKSSGVGPAAPARNQPAEGVAKSKEAGSPATDESAKVELSQAASSLISSGANSDFDQKKVERIAEAIQKGEFKINADKIADRLIANATEVLGKSH